MSTARSQLRLARPFFGLGTAPWSTIEQDLAQLFGAPAADNGDARVAFAPPVDVRETPEGYLLVAELPGVRPEDVHLEISPDGHTLTLEGSKAHATETDGRWHVRERVAGRFLRTFRLGAEIDLDRVEAGHDHGVLTVTLPRKAQAAPRKIAITRPVEASAAPTPAAEG